MEHRRHEPIEEPESEQGEHEGGAKLRDRIEAGRRGLPAAELLRDLTARLGDHLDDEREPERGDDEHAGAEHEHEVEQLATQVGPIGFGAPDRSEGRAYRGHHPARGPDQPGECDGTRGGCRWPCILDRGVHALGDLVGQGSDSDEPGNNVLLRGFGQDELEHGDE